MSTEISEKIRSIHNKHCEEEEEQVEKQQTDLLQEQQKQQQTEKQQTDLLQEQKAEKQAEKQQQPDFQQKQHEQHEHQENDDDEEEEDEEPEDDDKESEEGKEAFQRKFDKVWKVVKRSTTEFVQKYKFSLDNFIEVRSNVKGRNRVQSVFAKRDLAPGTILGFYPFSKIAHVSRTITSYYNFGVHAIYEDGEKLHAVAAELILTDKDRRHPLSQLCEPSEEKDSVNVVMAHCFGTFALAVVTIAPISAGQEVMVYYGKKFRRLKYNFHSQFMVDDGSLLTLKSKPLTFDTVVMPSKLGVLEGSELAILIEGIEKNSIVEEPKKIQKSIPLIFDVLKS